MSKTIYLTVGGMIFLMASAALMALNFVSLGYFFLALGASVLAAIGYVIHRYLVRTNVALRRNASSLRDAIHRVDRRVASLTEDFDQLAERGDSISDRFRNSSDVGNQEKVPGKAVALGNEALQPGDKTKRGSSVPVKRSSEWPEPILPHSPIGFFNRSATVQIEYARRIIQDPGRYEFVTYRLKSDALRNSFALAATGGEVPLLPLLQILRSRKFEGDFAEQPGWNCGLLLAIARILSNQRHSEYDLADAALIFDYVAATEGLEQFGEKDLYIFSETLQDLGYFKAAYRLINETRIPENDPAQAILVRANELAQQSQWGRWADELNGLFLAEGLAPISLAAVGNGKTKFDALRTESSAIRSVQGPLVSVIVPTFEGAERITTTLRCLVEQTWRNIEIIVVDDGSSSENLIRLREICASFADVFLYEQGENQGTYIARNFGVGKANGEFITIHDDDDWSHSQKIEVQATNLVENPEVVGNITRHVRSLESLRFVRINNNPSLRQPNYSSLMFRRNLINEIGDWDKANRGADSEFWARIKNVAKKTVSTIGNAPLSITRVHGGSLTAGEISRGYQDPSRLFYVASYQKMHRYWLTSREPGPFDLPRPLNMQPGKRGQHYGHFDVVVGGDFSIRGESTRLAARELKALSESGYRVGLLHLSSPTSGLKQKVLPEILELVEETSIDVLSLKDRATVGLLVLRTPSTMQFAENITTSFEVGKTLLIMDEPLVWNGVNGPTYDPLTVVKNIESIFSSPLQLVANSIDHRDFLREVYPELTIQERTWVGYYDLEDFRPKGTPSIRDFDRKAIVGRHSPDIRAAWPTQNAVYKHAYTSNSVFDVQLYGDLKSLTSKAAQLIRGNALIVSPRNLTIPEYLRTLDFWIFYEANPGAGKYLTEIIEAMASGLVVILHPDAKEKFGDAALYALPEEVGKMVERVWDFPSVYIAQSERARKFAEAYPSRLQFLEAVRSIEIAPPLNETTVR